MDDLISPLRAVCVLDPAIDRASSDMMRYARERDAGLIRELPGKRALWCTLRAFTVQDVMVIDGAPSAPMKARLAFYLGVVSIENWDGDKKLCPGGDEHVMRRGRPLQVWSDAELDMIAARCGMQFLYELGHLAFERALAGNGWSGSALYTLPQSSVDGLVKIDRRLAEQARSTAPAQASAQPAPG